MRAVADLHHITLPHTITGIQNTTFPHKRIQCERRHDKC